ncbi:hypothetical protein F5141DRAFT_1291186 [Pisolithus sp. B1]|nr:hypothetical protein F5141DRAFT_1291186 [Pisolithus sp. B1]
MVESQTHLPHLERHPKELDKGDIGSGYNNAVRRDIVNLHSIEKAPLNDRERQHSECEMKKLDDLPASHKPPPNALTHAPTTFMDPCHHGRIRTSAERVSGTHTSQIAYLTHVVPLWLLRGTEGTYLECTMGIPSPCTSKKTCPNKEDQDGERETSLQLQETRRPPPERDRMALGLSREKGCWYDDTVSSGFVKSRRIEKSMLAGSRSQHGERKAKCRNGLPVPPETPPNGCTHPPETYRVLRPCGRLKSKAESISNDQTRQNAYRVQAALKWPLLLLLAPSNQSLDPARGSWTMNVHYNEVRHVRQVETRGRTYRIAGIPMRLLQLLTNSSKQFIHPVGGLWMTKVCYNEMRRARQVEMRGGTYQTACILMQLLLFLSDPSKRLQNIGNTYWREGVPTGSTRNNAKWQGNIPMAIWRPRSSSMRQDIEHRAKWPNDLPTPFKPTQYDLSHLPGTLRDPRRRGRIKMKTENISRSETRGGKASILTITISPPREIAKLLWNVANTYWQHGIPPGRTRNIKNPLLFETAALRQRYETRGRAHTKRIPDMAVATTRSTATATTRHLALHTDSKLFIRRIHTHFIEVLGIRSFELYFLHLYLSYSGASGGVLEIESPLLILT